VSPLEIQQLRLYMTMNFEDQTRQGLTKL